MKAARALAATYIVALGAVIYDLIAYFPAG